MNICYKHSLVDCRSLYRVGVSWTFSIHLSTSYCCCLCSVHVKAVILETYYACSFWHWRRQDLIEKLPDLLACTIFSSPFLLRSLNLSYRSYFVGISCGILLHNSEFGLVVSCWVKEWKWSIFFQRKHKQIGFPIPNAQSWKYGT